MIPPKEAHHQQLLTPEEIGIRAEMQIRTCRWWEDFRDPQLNTLIEMGLRQNLNLQQVSYRLSLAKQQVLLNQAGQKVQANLKLNGGGLAAKGDFPSQNSAFALALPMVGYNLDFWGKIENRVLAASNREKAAQVNVTQARLALAVSIAQSYLNLQNNRQQKQVLHRMITNQKAAEEIIVGSVKRGFLPYEELLQSQSYSHLLRAELTGAKAQEILAKNQIALYLARTTEQLAPLVDGKLTLIAPLQEVLSIPMNLLARRPDIQGKKWIVQAYAAEIKVARTAFYPDFNLMLGGAFLAMTNIHPDKLSLLSGSIATSLPLYDGGLRDAGLSIANIMYDRAVLDYNQSLLGAVREASDAIILLKTSQEQEMLTGISTEKQRQAYDIARKKYQRGISPYLLMNQAESRWQQTFLNLIKTETATLQSQLRLIMALGGGYSPKAATEK
ncbi:efflux transporter outer membrane subunit [Desulfotalea psychrophila]|nr:efflux transporter outer membrane subunit [Desulfotalea psychrophila]